MFTSVIHGHTGSSSRPPPPTHHPGHPPPLPGILYCARPPAEGTRARHVENASQRGELDTISWRDDRSCEPSGPTGTRRYFSQIEGMCFSFSGLFPCPIHVLVHYKLDSYALLTGEGNGDPLQYSCLENSMDGGAW